MEPIDIASPEEDPHSKVTHRHEIKGSPVVYFPKVVFVNNVDGVSMVGAVTLHVRIVPVSSLTTSCALSHWFPEGGDRRSVLVPRPLRPEKLSQTMTLSNWNSDKTPDLPNRYVALVELSPGAGFADERDAY